MHDDAYIGGRSENNIKCVVHNDLGWKIQTTLYILLHHWLYEWFSQFHRCGTYSVLSQGPSIISYYVPPLIGRGIKRWCCLTSVCLSVEYIGPKSRTERPKAKIGTEVGHVTRDLDTTFKVKGHQAALVGCSSNYIIYMEDTIFFANAQSEPLPVDHEYSWRLAPQAWGAYGLELGCSVRHTGAGAYCMALRTACSAVIAVHASDCNWSLCNCNWVIARFCCGNCRFQFY